MDVRLPFATLVVSALAIAGCGRSAEPPAAASDAPASSAPTAPRTTSAPAPPAVDRDAPCTWVSPAEVNAALGTAFDEGTAKSDDARQIRTCHYQQTSPFAIVDVALALVPGADAYQTNWDLAPAYFDADPRALELPGTEKAYVIPKKDPAAWIVGLLVNGRFALVQVAVESATEAQATALAATIATRMK